MKVMNQFAEGMNLNDILDSHKSILDSLSHSRKQNELIVKKHLKIVDGLAICDLSETGIRTNGYLVTAIAGSEALACCVIHGFYDGTIEDVDRPALSASFYANSFREEANPYDLSKLATLLDETGGGHANACGCRIQPMSVSETNLTEDDKKYNLAKWLDLWSRRNQDLIR